MTKQNLAELRQEYDELYARTKELATRGSDLTGSDVDNFEEATARLEEIAPEIKRIEQNIERVRSFAAGPQGAEFSQRGDNYRETAKPKTGGLNGIQVLTRDQSISNWVRDNGVDDSDQTDEEPNFDKFIRGLVTGDWHGAQLERALSEGTSTAGGVLVPTPLAAQVIDMARNQSRVIEAGAQIVPMTSQTLRVPRVVSDPAPAWRSENAQIAAQDMVFDSVLFTARSLDRLIILSRELFEDSDPTAASSVIAQSFAAGIATELDRVALRGTGTAPEPRGVLNTSGVTLTSHRANGASINYDWLLDAVGAVRNAGYEPNAHILAPRSATSLGKLKDSAGNYLTAPANLLPILPTRQAPVNLTVGTSSDASEIYTGAWGMLGIGVRTGFEISILKERWADFGQVGILAHLRADVQLFQPAAFAVDLGVRA